MHVILGSESSTHSMNQVFDKQICNKNNFRFATANLKNTVLNWTKLRQSHSTEKNVRFTGSHSETLLTVYCRHSGRWLKSIGSASTQSNRPSRKYAGGSHTSQDQIGWSWWSWSSRFRRFANLVARSRRRRFRPVTSVWNIWCSDDFQLFEVTYGSKYSKRFRVWWQQIESSLPDRSTNCRNRLGYPRTVVIHQEITPTTPETVAEHYFRSAATTVEMVGSTGQASNNRNPSKKHLPRSSDQVGWS